MKYIALDAELEQVHFLVQTFQTCTVTKMVTLSKFLTAHHMFKECPKVKKLLRGVEFWSRGFFVNTLRNMITNQ